MSSSVLQPHGKQFWELGRGHVIPSNPEEAEWGLPGLLSPPAQALHSLLMM